MKTDISSPMAMDFMMQFPQDTAKILEDEPAELAARFLETLPTDTFVTTLTMMLPNYVAKIITHWSPDFIATIFSDINDAFTVSVLRYLKPSFIQKILSNLPEKKKATCKVMLSFSKEAVGAWMINNILLLPEEINVKDALHRIKHSKDVHTADTYFIVDRHLFPKGMINVTQLLKADETLSITSLIKPIPVFLNKAMMISKALELSDWKEMNVLPVINKEKMIIGETNYGLLLSGMMELNQTALGAPKIKPLSAVCDAYTSLVSSFTVGFSKLSLKTDDNPLDEKK
jgi:magnesium transporter